LEKTLPWGDKHGGGKTNRFRLWGCGGTWGKKNWRCWGKGMGEGGEDKSRKKENRCPTNLREGQGKSISMAFGNRPSKKGGDQVKGGK